MGAGQSTALEALQATQKRLAAGDIPRSESAFWAQVLGRSTTDGSGSVLVFPQDAVFEALEPDVLRTMCEALTTREKKKRSGNLRRLVRACIDALVEFAETEMRSARVGDLSHDGTRVGPQELAKRTHNRQAAMNAIRILTRAIPVIMEDPKAEHLVFWDLGQGAKESVPAGKTEADDSVAKTEKSHRKKKGAHIIRRPSKAPELLRQGKRGVPEAHRLLDVLQALLFLEDFTVGRQRQAPNLEQRGWLLPLHYVWSAGVGTADVVPPSADMKVMMGTRVEILRCLLACFSTVLFEPPVAPRTLPQDDRRSRWVQYIAGRNGYYDLALFFSLLNSGLTYDPIGWGVPYNYMLFADDAEPLADASMHVLLVLLFHQSSSGDPNVYAEFAASLSRLEDYEVLFESLMRLLRNPAYAGNTWMPASTKEIECHQELLLLFWKLLESNVGFRAHVTHQAPVLLAQLCDTLLYYLREYYTIPGQSGLVYLCVFMLLLLSAEREFALALNEPFASKLPGGWPALPIAKGAAKRAAAALVATQSSVDPSARAAERRRKVLAGIGANAAGNVSDQVRTVQGDGYATYSDYLILVFHKLFTSLDSKSLTPLLEPMCTVLSNVSPYLKQLTTHASVALVRLLERYSKPSFLFAAEHNPRIMGYFFEVFNNLLQYQANTHHRLVYATVFKQEVVEDLSGLTFDAGMEKFDADAAGDWKPTEDWFKDWHEKLPLSPMERMISAIVPLLKAAQEQNAAAGLSPLSEEQMMAVVQRNSLVGVLPVPHPILIRRYEKNDFTSTWFTGFLWGLIFRRVLSPSMFLPSARAIKIFTVMKAPGLAEDEKPVDDGKEEETKADDLS